LEADRRAVTAFKARDLELAWLKSVEFWNHPKRSGTRGGCPEGMTLTTLSDQ